MGSDEAIQLARSQVVLGPSFPPWSVFGPNTRIRPHAPFEVLECDHEADALRVCVEWIAEVALQLIGHPNPVEAINHVATSAGPSATTEQLVRMVLSAPDC